MASNVSAESSLCGDYLKVLTTMAEVVLDLAARFWQQNTLNT